MVMQAALEKRIIIIELSCFILFIMKYSQRRFLFYVEKGLQVLEVGDGNITFYTLTAFSI